MSYKDFITTMLNVKPKDLSSITSLKQEDGSIILKIKLVPKYILCPTCNSPTKIHGYYSRKLTHSTLANRSCTIYYQQRRYKCPQCEISFCETNPFIDSSEHLTFETKFNVLTELKYPEATYTSVARRYNLSVSKVIRLFDKHIDIQRKPLPEVLSIDEHYLPNSDQNAKYCCLFLNLNIKETLQTIPKALDEAIQLFESSGINEFDEFHKLLVNWHDEIINSFTLINGRRINNSFMESKNRIVEKIIFNANGLKNFKRTRNRLL